jgi:NTP pyrophosphatase (non-canonical NTP hydrolase)
MQTSHFNCLGEAEQERLAILMEECSEVIKAAAKILRHGYASDNNGKMAWNNRQDLEKEIGDVLHSVAMMQERHDISVREVDAHLQAKRQSIKPYLHHQCGEGARRPRNSMAALRYCPQLHYQDDRSRYRRYKYLAHGNDAS